MPGAHAGQFPLASSNVPGLQEQTLSKQTCDSVQSAAEQQAPSRDGSRQALPLVPAPQQTRLSVQQMSGEPSPGQKAPGGQQVDESFSPPRQTVSQHPSTSQQC